MRDVVLVAWLRDTRRATLGWGAALVAVAALYGSLWPQVVNPQMQRVLASYPQSLLDALGYQDLTAASYLTAQVYGLVGAVLVIAFGVSRGARMVAGDEEAGLLELLLAHPVGRVSLALQRFCGFETALAAICVALWAALAGIDAATHIPGEGLGGLAAMSVQLWVFGSLFAAVAFGVGAGTGRRTAALAVPGGLAVLTFTVNGLVSQVAHLGWTRHLSPFHWLTQGAPMTNGLQVLPVLVPVVLTLAVVAAGALALDRRDLG